MFANAIHDRTRGRSAESDSRRHGDRSHKGTVHIVELRAACARECIYLPYCVCYLEVEVTSKAIIDFLDK